MHSELCYLLEHWNNHRSIVINLFPLNQQKFEFYFLFHFLIIRLTKICSTKDEWVHHLGPEPAPYRI